MLCLQLPWRSYCLATSELQILMQGFYVMQDMLMFNVTRYLIFSMLKLICGTGIKIYLESTAITNRSIVRIITFRAQVSGNDGIFQ